MTYSMTCTCGDVMMVDAATREEAVSKMKAMMTAEAISAHFHDKHPGQTMIIKAESDAMIDQRLQLATPTA